ncbi:MAG: hypothetical protein SFV53_00365 [Rickettsiales bacterium]|nr:hypothetical protein [Rickettsiales bacterium]
MKKIFKTRSAKLIFYCLILAILNFFLTNKEGSILQPLVGILFYAAIFSIFFDCYKRRLPTFVGAITALLIIIYIIAYQLSQNQFNKIDQEISAAQKQSTKIAFDIKSDKLVFAQDLGVYKIRSLMQFYDFPAIYFKTSDPKKFISYSIFDQDFCRQLTKKLGLKSANSPSQKEIEEDDKNDDPGVVLVGVSEQVFSSPNSEIAVSYLKNFQPSRTLQSGWERHKTIRKVCLLKQVEILETDRIFHIDISTKKRHGFIFNADETHIKITTPQKEEINLMASARIIKEPFFVFLGINNQQKGYGEYEIEKITKIFSIEASNIATSSRLRSNDEILPKTVETK